MGGGDGDSQKADDSGDVCQAFHIEADTFSFAKPQVRSGRQSHYIEFFMKVGIPALPAF